MDLELQQRLRAVRTQGIGGSATAWQSMGCAETVALTLPGDQSHAIHPALPQPSPAARGPRRSLAVVSLIADKRYYGETPGRLPTCPRRWAERAAAGEGPAARVFGEPTWAGGVNADSGNRQRGGPKHSQATYWYLYPAPPGEIRK